MSNEISFTELYQNNIARIKPKKINRYLRFRGKFCSRKEDDWNWYLPIIKKNTDFLEKHNIFYSRGVQKLLE